MHVAVANATTTPTPTTTKMLSSEFWMVWSLLLGISDRIYAEPKAHITYVQNYYPVYFSTLFKLICRFEREHLEGRLFPYYSWRLNCFKAMCINYSSGTQVQMVFWDMLTHKHFIHFPSLFFSLSLFSSLILLFGSLNLQMRSSDVINFLLAKVQRECTYSMCAFPAGSIIYIVSM